MLLQSTNTKTLLKLTYIYLKIYDKRLHVLKQKSRDP